MTDPGGSTTTTPSGTDAPPPALDELTLGDLLERLAGSDAVPGGGSAAALAGALSAALLSMVASLSESRATDEYATVIRVVANAAGAARAELTTLASLDAAAYDAVVRARRLPRDTEGQRAARSAQVGAATRLATEMPLRTARAAAALLDLAERLAPVGNRHAISDVGVAAHLAAAAVRGAVLNVRINLPYLPDLAEGDALFEARDELEDLIARAAAAEARLIGAVAHRMEG